MNKNDIKEVLNGFQITAQDARITPFGSGHINDTFKVTTYEADGSSQAYTLQRINHCVFPHPDWVMENISRVLDHISQKPEALGNMKMLKLIQSKEGLNYVLTPVGTWWRMYHFIDGVETYDIAEDPQIVYEAAKGFAKFQSLIAELPLPRLHETISNFHHTPMRYSVLEEAIYEDLAGRVSSIHSEIKFVRKRRHLCSRLLSRHLKGEIPERITHNDTKLNNALFDCTTKECTLICDFDTIMPGLALYDFGDLIRTSANTADESEPDVSKVQFNIVMFEAAVRGYLERADFLVPAEIEELTFSAWLITFMVGLRFLTDYIQGDTYFKIHYPHQNLDRARVQFTLCARMEDVREEMQAIVQRIARELGRI